jgi:sterol desaturase/sphingolipid hydroxylase (fatty acid hydroxylase superfamily)
MIDSLLNTPYHQPRWFLLFVAITFTSIFARYLLFSAAFHYAGFVWFRTFFKDRVINHVPQTRAQIWREIRRSALTSLIFAFFFGLIFVLWQAGYTKIYLSWSDYPLYYHPLSLLIALLLHETYYYWLHRWMHLPTIYRIIHRWHHESIHTSSMSAFSFHPLESGLQAAFIPLLILTLPLHLYVLIFLLLLMTVSGTINHCGIEVFPKNFERHWMGKWLIGATHHDLHHKRFQYNFGLYFTFWDRWMKTECPGFKKIFRKKTAHPISYPNNSSQD